MPTLDELNTLVRETFTQIQDTLPRLEEEAQTNDRPLVHTLTRSYARLLSPLRDYMTSASMGRPLPRQLSRRIGEAAEPIFDHADEVHALALRPDAEALTRLIQAAETAT